MRIKDSIGYLHEFELEGASEAGHLRQAISFEITEPSYFVRFRGKHIMQRKSTGRGNGGAKETRARNVTVREKSFVVKSESRISTSGGRVVCGDC